MSFDNILTLLVVVGFGYMMFRGGGCCGSHRGHKDHHSDGSETGINTDSERGPDR
jgi:hypothetical protein